MACASSLVWFLFVIQNNSWKNASKQRNAKVFCRKVKNTDSSKTPQKPWGPVWINCWQNRFVYCLYASSLTTSLLGKVRYPALKWMRWNPFNRCSCVKKTFSICYERYLGFPVVAHAICWLFYIKTNCILIDSGVEQANQIHGTKKGGKQVTEARF